MCASLVEATGLHRRLDEVEHVIAHLNVVHRECPRRADPDRGLVRRLIVGLGERNAHLDALCNKEIHLQAARAGPVRHLGGVATRGVQVAPRCREDPEITEEMVPEQPSAMGLLCHPQAVRPDQFSLLPMPCCHQIEHHHAPHRHGVDRGAVTADLLVSLFERNPEVGHGVDAVRGERQLHDPPRFDQGQPLQTVGQDCANLAGGFDDLPGARAVHQDHRIQACFDLLDGVVGLLSMSGVASVVGDRQ